MTISVALFAGALAVGLMQVALAADTRSPAEEAADRAAIEALMWRYVRALDSLDADGTRRRSRRTARSAVAATPSTAAPSSRR